MEDEWMVGATQRLNSGESSYGESSCDKSSVAEAARLQME